MEGTAYLLSQGIARQEPQNQARWVSLASSLLDANLTVTPLPDSPTTANQTNEPLSSKTNNASSATSAAKSTTMVATSISNNVSANLANNTVSDTQPEWQFSVQPLSDENSEQLTSLNNRAETYIASFRLAPNQQLIELEFNGISEHILTGTAFFILNEIGRLSADKRQHAFNQLTKHFHYDTFRLRQDDLSFDSRQLERLNRGETIVELEKQFGRGLAINVYAPWGTTTDVLALGPIAFFDPFPTYIAALVLSSALIAMALVVMLIIRRLSHRLIALQIKVDAITPELISHEHDAENTDIIAALNQKIQDMAERIQKLLDDKAYMIRAVSHDLRTPIAKIHFRLEALSQKLGSDNKLITGSHQDLKQLNLLIDELLTYEKLSVKQDIQFQSVDLIKLINDEIDSLKIIKPQLTIEFHCENLVIPTPNNGPQACTCYIEANDILLRRLFENILQNAGRYASSAIKIALTQADKTVLIIIDDDGQGLDESHISHLFEPFFRSDASRNSANGGYGLGLAIVQQIAMQHNAVIAAENNEQGGARFTFTFPYRQVHDV